MNDKSKVVVIDDGGMGKARLIKIAIEVSKPKNAGKLITPTIDIDYFEKPEPMQDHDYWNNMKPRKKGKARRW